MQISQLMKDTFLLLSIIVMLCIFGCTRQQLFFEGTVNLSFSTDTLRFDTVFTELGSATRILKVYNSEDRWIRVDRIALENTDGSTFRMNVDGIPTREALDVEIPPNDSIYIFCEVTVDPDQPLSISPFVIESAIIFETSGNEAEVVLEAWGQNANYIPDRFSRDRQTIFSCNGEEWLWNDEKPYVIYGVVFIDDCTLTIAEGTQIYVHGGLVRDEVNGVFNTGVLYILDEGRLNIQGTAENPVIIQGDRLEEAFEEEAGQWRGIFIGRNSKGNVINHTTIKNSSFGIYADSASTLAIRNSQIYNTASSGLIGLHSTISMDNSLIYNNGFHGVQLIFGGDYNFNYCTVASYGVDASALLMSNFICYVPEGFGCAFGATYRLNATFNNSIFFGNRRDEIQLIDATEGTDGQFNYQFNNSIVRVQELLDSYPDFFEFCTECPENLGSQDPLFFSVNQDDYRLDSLSVARNLGRPLNNINIDLLNNRRDTEQPDAGCLEFEE